MLQGVGSCASVDEIKSAFREKARQCHPDKVIHVCVRERVKRGGGKSESFIDGSFPSQGGWYVGTEHPIQTESAIDLSRTLSRSVFLSQLFCRRCTGVCMCVHACFVIVDVSKLTRVRRRSKTQCLRDVAGKRCTCVRVTTCGYPLFLVYFSAHKTDATKKRIT